MLHNTDGVMNELRGNFSTSLFLYRPPGNSSTAANLAPLLHLWLFFFHTSSLYSLYMNQLKSVTSHSQLQHRSNPGLFCEDKVHKKQVLFCFFFPNLSCLGKMSAVCGCRSQECVESQSGGATFCSASQLWNLSFQGKRGGNKKKQVCKRLGFEHR